MTRTAPRSAHLVSATTAPTWPRLFADRVASAPDAVAVCAGTPGGDEYAELTYAELDDRAARLASVLAARGAEPEQLVALAVPGLVAGRRVLGVWSQGVFFSLGDLPHGADCDCEA